MCVCAQVYRLSRSPHVHLRRREEDIGRSLTELRAMLLSLSTTSSTGLTVDVAKPNVLLNMGALGFELGSFYLCRKCSYPLSCLPRPMLFKRNYST